MNRFIPMVWCTATALAAATSSAAPAAGRSLQEEPLELRQAVALALQHQPMLEAISAEAQAARHAAISAEQLPDPQLFAGIRDLAIDTDDAYSFTRDSDTQLIIGVMQEFPRAQKRRLRGQQRSARAERLDFESALTERVIRRDVSLGWLALWREARAQHVAAASLGQGRTQAQAVENSFSSGRSTESDAVAARIEVERLEDEVAKGAQAVASARHTLRRWIGGAAERPVVEDLPPFSPPPDRGELVAHLSGHPELQVLEARIDEANVNADLARAAYQPDWRVELGYGHRPEFSEMVMLQVGLDLPLFTGNRQDRDLDRALALGAAARAAWEDGRRRLESEALLLRDDLDRLSTRATRYNDTILPQTGTRIDAALAAWRSGRGTLTQVLESRRSRLEMELVSLDLLHDVAKRHVELAYLTVEGTPR